MSLVATLAVLMLMLMPAAAASIPAVKSAQCPPGHIVSGGYCTPMFRPTPGLRGPPLSGKRNFKTRDEGTEAASLVHGACCGVVAPDSPMGARYYPAGAVRIAMTKCDVLLSLSRGHMNGAQ